MMQEMEATDKAMDTTECVDQTWTLFLDRDGVINEEALGSYITSWSEFRFCEGALEAISRLSPVFGKVIVVTNQRGVGRGIMSMEILREIHQNMHTAITGSGGRIDKIYAATAVSDEDHNRKPNTGMGLQSREDFPEIDFRKSVMVGNSLSDMEFGKRLGMHTVFLTTKSGPYEDKEDLMDEQFPDLAAWSLALEAKLERNCEGVE